MLRVSRDMLKMSQVSLQYRWFTVDPPYALAVGIDLVAGIFVRGLLK